MKKIVPACLLVCAVVSARAATFSYSVNFSDAGEALPSPGFGLGTVIYDDAAHTLTLACTFSNLLGGTTASHIHAPTASPFTGNASVATTTPSLVGFPLGVTNGAFNGILDLTQSTSWNPRFITANGGTTATAEAAFAGFIAAGRAYWNIHSSYDSGGEIRGFLVPVPEPSGVAIISLFAGVTGLVRRYRRRGMHVSRS